MKILSRILFAFLVIAASTFCQRILQNSDSSHCLKVVGVDSDKKSARWWSTLLIIVKVKNTCETPIALNKASLLVKDFEINGKIPSKSYVSISGSPYLENSLVIKEKDFEILLSTMSCSDNCHWAHIGAGVEHTITINNGYEGFIDKFSYSSISLSCESSSNSTSSSTTSDSSTSNSSSSISESSSASSSPSSNTNDSSSSTLDTSSSTTDSSSFAPLPSPSETNPSSSQSSKSDSSRFIGGYYASWSASWKSIDNAGEHSLANIPSYVQDVLISFASPTCNYIKGSFSFAGTGLNFSSDFDVIKKAISIGKQKHPKQNMLLSVGGATYPWTTPNYTGMVALMEDLGLDGIDIDYEDSPVCTDINTEKVKCSTDKHIMEIIENLRPLITNGKLLTTAAFSVGAYGNEKYPTTVYTPASSYSGMWINPIKKLGHLLDIVYIMSYDAGPTYNPKDAFLAYRSIFKGSLVLGLEVPPEAWGGNVLTVDKTIELSIFILSQEKAGMFIWSLHKTSGSTNSHTFLKVVCEIFELVDCNKKIPLN